MAKYKYDVTDEAIINAEPDIVFNALLAEYEGKTSWWMPHLSAKLQKGDAAGQIGTLIDFTLHGKSPIKFTAKVVEVKKNELIRTQYIEGAFRGEGLWKLEAIEGNTKVSFRWRTNLAGGLLFRIMRLFINVPKHHSDVMKAGFEGLNEHLKKKS
jgi:uncharacterized protein YndB with AHSA1/START domain